MCSNTFFSKGGGGFSCKVTLKQKHVQDISDQFWFTTSRGTIKKDHILTDRQNLLTIEQVGVWMKIPYQTQLPGVSSTDTDSKWQQLQKMSENVIKYSYKCHQLALLAPLAVSSTYNKRSTLTSS